MSDEPLTRWTRERRRQGDGGDLHPFLSAAAWAASVAVSGLAVWFFYADAGRAPLWAALCLGALAFTVAYPLLLYAHWTGAFYEREREEPVISESEAPSVRPFVPSQNAPATIRVGSWRLPRETWAALFDVARANGGRLTRDAVTKARALPRELYRDWSATLGELQRLGFVDETGRVTTEGWTFARGLSPRSAGAETLVQPPSTHARRTHGANGPDLTLVGEAD